MKGATFFQESCHSQRSLNKTLNDFVFHEFCHAIHFEIHLGSVWWNLLNCIDMQFSENFQRLFFCPKYRLQWKKMVLSITGITWMNIVFRFCLKLCWISCPVQFKNNSHKSLPICNLGSSNPFQCILTNQLDHKINFEIFAQLQSNAIHRKYACNGTLFLDTIERKIRKFFVRQNWRGWKDFWKTLLKV